MNNSLAKAQRAYDNQLPEEDDGRQDFIDEQAELLLNADDARDVDFFAFAGAAHDAIADADDNEYAVVQIILAVRRGDHELAEKLAMRFEDVIVKAAEKIVEGEME